MPWSFSSSGNPGGMSLASSGNPGGMNLIKTPSTIITNGLVMNLDAGDTTSYPGSGTTWTDLSGNGINGTLVGATFDSGNGGSIFFNGTSGNYVDCGTSNTVSFSGNFTINAWIKLSSTANQQMILSKRTTTASPNGFINYEFQTVTAGSTSIRLYMQSDQFANGAAQGSSISTGTWYYMTGLRNGSGLTFYYNGTSVGTGTAPSPGVITPPTVNWSTTTLRLSGGASWGGANFNGYIGGVHMYNRALTTAEILENFNVTRGRFGV